MAKPPISSRLQVEDGSTRPDRARVARGHKMSAQAQDGKMLGGNLTPFRVTPKRPAPKQK